MPTAKPLFIPDQIKNDPDLTPEQKEAIARKLRRAATSRRSAYRLAAQSRKQKRKDDDHRKIVAGGVAEAEAAENAKFTAFWIATLKKRVRETERFLFPEVWPDAKRPEKQKKQAGEQAVESAEENTKEQPKANAKESSAATAS